MTALNFPAIGSTGWGANVNSNWTSIQNSLTSMNGLRLTSTSGSPIPSDAATVGTIYLTPFSGNAISLYNTAGAGNWDCFNTAEVSLALSGLAASTNYDVFAYLNGSAVALELSAAWTNDTTRADAITMVSGVWLKSSNNTRRLVGTIRTISASATTDTVSQRFLWNINNQVERKLLVTSSASWSYGTAAWRAANNSTALRVEVVVGLALSSLWISVNSVTITNGTTIYTVGIGEDSTTATAHDRSVAGYGITGASFGAGSTADLTKYVPQGHHYYQWIEYAISGTAILNTQTTDHAGLFGAIFA
jgi:hypothetical protein